MLSKDDQKTLVGIQSRDEAVFRHFYTTHRGALLSFLMRKLDDQDAEEVLHDSFLAFLEALRDFQGKSSLKTFLFSIAKRKAVDKLRKQKVKKILFSYIPAHIVESLAAVVMKDTIDATLLQRKIFRVLKLLPNDYARVLRLKYSEGFKISQIAAEVELSPKATESLVFRARQAFKIMYEKDNRSDLRELGSGTS